MEFLFDLAVVIHMVGWAIVLGGYVASIRSPGLYRGVLHGALTALVGGIAALAIDTWGLHATDIDPAKMTVKIAVTVVIAALATVAASQGRKGDNGTGAVTPVIKHAIGVLTVANIVVAVFWN